MARVAQTRQDDRALQVFFKAIEVAGGSRGLVEHRRLDWLPPLMESACVVVLQEDEHKTPEEITALLGLSDEELESILASATDTAVDRFEHNPPADPLERENIAGGLARLGRDALAPQASVNR